MQKYISTSFIFSIIIEELGFLVIIINREHVG